MKILRRYWQDWGNFAIGLWLFMSPWFLGFSMETPAVWNSMVVGALIVVLSSFAALVHQVAEEWVNMAFGIWLMISPWVLGFSGDSMATGNTVFFGAVVTAFSAWVMLRDLGLAKWWHAHYHAFCVKRPFDNLFHANAFRRARGSGDLSPPKNKLLK